MIRQVSASTTKFKSSHYGGVVKHTRHLPRFHTFQYNFGVAVIPLIGDEDSISKSLINSDIKGTFKRKNYFGDKSLSLSTSVLKYASDRKGRIITGDVIFIGQLESYGFYFSPVNFYLIQDTSRKQDRNSGENFSYLVAEVTNTPWKERYCYIIDLNESDNSHEKAFHVSPFNPMDMTYQWTIKVSVKSVFVKIECFREKLEFEAEIIVSKNKKTVKSISMMNFKILLGIYLQAALLFLKKTPFYSHPTSKEVS